MCQKAYGCRQEWRSYRVVQKSPTTYPGRRMASLPASIRHNGSDRPTKSAYGANRSTHRCQASNFDASNGSYHNHNTGITVLILRDEDQDHDRGPTRIQIDYGLGTTSRPQLPTTILPTSPDLRHHVHSRCHFIFAFYLCRLYRAFEATLTLTLL